MSGLKFCLSLLLAEEGADMKVEVKDTDIIGLDSKHVDQIRSVSDNI